MDSQPADVMAAMEQFLARIAPFDPRPGAKVVSVEMRAGRVRGGFELTERSARALCEALARYTDPDDHGRCSGCGGHLDRNLQCPGCGYVGGVFGETIAHRAAEIASRGEG
ncbi:hypothetical protein [Polymorphospora sp. NPDC050346]|uniref:hypothetical protein n=1 Tax=Polymorphospora sp. NPDC050346 TaxID=3155780 RepID=UPI0033C6E9FA